MAHSVNNCSLCRQMSLYTSLSLALQPLILLSFVITQPSMFWVWTPVAGSTKWLTFWFYSFYVHHQLAKAITHIPAYSMGSGTLVCIYFIINLSLIFYRVMSCTLVLPCTVTVCNCCKEPFASIPCPNITVPRLACQSILRGLDWQASLNSS